MSQCLVGRIEGRRLVTTVERCDMSIKYVGRRPLDLEEKVKHLEGEVEVVRSTNQSIDIFIVNVITSQALHAHTSKNVWVVDSSFTHHMEKVLGVELDYLPCIQMSCFNSVWTPYSNKGAFPPTIVVTPERIFL